MAHLLLDTTALIDALRGRPAGVGARVATGNPKDFPMVELEVEHWPAGD
jgi:predicted nucleic acid-binding protein